MKSWRLSSLSPTSPRWTCCCLDGPSCTFAFYLLIYCLYVLFRELPFQVMGAFISFSEHCSFRFVDTLSRLYIGIRSVVCGKHPPTPRPVFGLSVNRVYSLSRSTCSRGGRRAGRRPWLDPRLGTGPVLPPLPTHAALAVAVRVVCTTRDVLGNRLPSWHNYKALQNLHRMEKCKSHEKMPRKRRIERQQRR